MGTIFGKRNRSPISNPGAGVDRSRPQSQQDRQQDRITEKDRAILDLKNVRDKLKRYRQRLEKDSEKLEFQARELIAMKQKNRALLVLKLKKFKREELEGLDQRLMNVLKTIEDVEWASINMKVIGAIEAGTRELNRMHEEMPLEKVQALMGESDEAFEVRTVQISGCAFM
jgi:charged multivesicular body protein 6